MKGSLFIGLMSLMLVTGPLLAQQARPPQEPREGGPPQRPEGQPRPDGPHRMIPQMMPVLELMHRYLELVDRFSRMARDPSTAGVAAALGAKDLLEKRGTDAAIEYFDKVMPEVRNDTVRRAIRIQLIELYKNSGQHDKALDQMRTLMIEAPPGGESPGR